MERYLGLFDDFSYIEYSKKYLNAATTLALPFEHIYRQGLIIFLSHECIQSKTIHGHDWKCGKQTNK